MESIFGIGIAELIFIAIIALIVLGPERLPGAIRSVTSVIRQIRNLSNELTSQFSEEFKTLEEINPKNLIKELSNDLLGEDEDKNSKGAGAKPGSTKAGVTTATSRNPSTTAATTKATTRAATTTKPATATSAPKSPTTPAKKVVTTNEEARAVGASAKPAAGAVGAQKSESEKISDPKATDAIVPAGADNEKAPADKTMIDDVVGDRADKTGEEKNAPGTSATGPESKAAPRGLPGGIGKKNAGAAFTAGSIPKHMGIPAKSRKAVDSPVEQAQDDAESSTERATHGGIPSAEEPAARLVENSILPPEIHPITDDEDAESEKSRATAVPNSEAAEDSGRVISKPEEAVPAASASAPASVPASTTSLRVNGKSGDSQSKA